MKRLWRLAKRCDFNTDKMWHEIMLRLYVSEEVLSENSYYRRALYLEGLDPQS